MPISIYNTGGVRAVGPGDYFLRPVSRCGWHCVISTGNPRSGATDKPGRTQPVVQGELWDRQKPEK